MTTQSQQNFYDEGDEISLKELILKVREWLYYLSSKWFIIICFALLGGILGFVYAYFKKPIYTATTTFVLEDEKSSSGLGGLAGLASMTGVNIGTGGGIFQGDNIFSLYKSRAMLKQTLFTPLIINGQTQLLIDRYIEFNNLKDKLSGKVSITDLNFKNYSIKSSPDRLKDSILNEIVLDLNENYLDVTKPDKKLNLIKVDVKANDEIFAKAFNDALVKNVNQFYVSTKIKKTLKNVDILQLKTDSVRAVLKGLVYSSAKIIDATPNINPTKQAQRTAPVQSSQFSAETNKAMLSELIKNLEMTKVSLLKEEPLIQLVDAPIYPLIVIKIGKIKGILLGVIFGLLIGVLSMILLKIYTNIISYIR